ncbi:MAG TPA: 16S rRNA (uracil(1498)-N(3))-methyltransferase, partial [Gammaproteobacteria bacterium]|nr:16S rRNA (uracil(1498)-N(3))-methyltransferase [Gammaproteobacteria bacterium]
MRKHRFFVLDSLAVDQTLSLNDDLSHQIARVLRLQVNDPIFLFNNSGAEFSAIITEIARKAISVTITAVNNLSLESPCKIQLGQVVGKDQKMDLVFQKATELGVDTITPLFSEFSVKKNVPDRNANKLEHWQKIAIAASGQCWRNIVPTINAPQDLFSWIEQNNAATKLLLSPNAAAKHLRDVSATNSISILIGPEGGFSETEVT